MTLSKILIVILSAIIAVCAVFIIILQKKSKKFLVLQNSYEKIIFYEKLSIENECIRLSDTLRIIDLSGNRINIEDIASRHRYVYRFPMFDCAACVENELKNLKEQIEEIKNANLFCIFVHGLSIRSILLFFKENKINCDVYITEDSNLGLSIDKYNIPYYFHLSEDLIVSNIFIPAQWNNNDYNDLYNFYKKNCINKKSI